MFKKNIYLIEWDNNSIAGSKLPSIKIFYGLLCFNMRLIKLNLNESAALVIEKY